MQRQLTLDVLVTDGDRRAALADDVRTGLTREAKALPPVWFYDDAGSRLFDLITRLPEYYPTRVETAILRGAAGDIVERTGADTLVEIGSGTSEKTRLLLDAMAAAGSLRRVVLFDISVDVLREASEKLAHDYDVDVHAVVGDFNRHLHHVPRGGRRLWAFLGSTIGNVVGAQQLRLLRDFRSSMTTDDHLVLGTDLVKRVDRIVAAYDDSAGVTAAFNRNVLDVLNRELHATFDPGRFDHVVRWDADNEWVEMRLRSRVQQRVTVRDLSMAVDFRQGEDLLTEISDKFRPARLTAELESAGLVPAHVYRDDDGDFQLTLAGQSAGW